MRFSRFSIFFLFLEHSLHDVLKEESKATFGQEARKQKKKAMTILTK